MSPKKYCNYTKDELKEAIKAVQNGMSCAAASVQFKIPRITLLYKIKGKYSVDCKSGVDTVLTAEEETILSNWIIQVGKTGFPVTKDQLLDSVSLLVKTLNRKTNFTNGRPGRHWYEGFMRRHSHISERMTQNLTTNRASVTEMSVRAWFNEIEHYLNENNINISNSRQVFNADETAFFLSPKGKKALVEKGMKTVYNSSGNEKDCLTTIVVGNAAGELAPTMVMYPYERIPKHIILQMPEEWSAGKSENGWMTSESFFEYITNTFYPWLIHKSIPFPVLLYVDGHKSHLTLKEMF